MTSKEPSKKDAKQGKQGAQSFQEPPTQQSQQTDDQYSEEAGVHSFSEPSTEQGFREEAEAPESQTAFLGVDENLLQIKREIENQLLQGVSQQKASTHAEDAFQGRRTRGRFGGHGGRTLRAGDVMLIRQHAPGPDSGLTAACNVNQFESIAMEFWDANFDAIKHATAKGIVVSEAAGNGSMNLDSPVYNRKFDRSVRDSGAIVAGAGLADARLPQCTANIGSRVDIPEWGQTVVSTWRVPAALAATRSQLRSESAIPGRVPPGGDDSDPPISVPPACLAQAKTSLTATPPTIDPGGRTTLKWSVQLPITCPPDLDQWLQLNGVPVALVGSQSVQPLSSTTFFLTMPFPRGTAKLATTTVTVNLPKVVDIKGSTLDWATLMAKALAIPGETVRLAPNVDMDLSGAQDIVIAEGVSFLGGEPCPVSASSTALTPFQLCGAHDAQHLGPRLFTNTRPKHLFLVDGDNVRIEGFRLHGRDFGTVTCQDCDIPYGIAIFGKLGIEIANMELAGWSGGAISVNEEGLPDRLTRDNARFDTLVNRTVWIHDNFFHHNLHHGQYGYGVDLAHGAYARIESNVFDFNRHAITSGGDAGTGYFARRNLILKGTTLEGACTGSLNLCATTHEFDVHGTDSCNVGDQNCGQAGEYFEMTENAFQYAIGYSIKVRGNPTIGALVASNVFANSEGDAIAQNGNGEFITPIQRRGNVFGVDTYGKYGVCDFDGDGIDDLFLATGVSWWYRSGARMHWVYLNSSTERLEQIGLGDFDGDHRCDVFSVHGNDFGIYPGGTGAWKSLGTYGVPFSELRFGDFNGDGIMDIFRRAPDSQWWIISPGHYGWTPVQSSPKPLSELRFGDFNNDRITDVISLQNGGWAVSWGGRTVWQPLNSLTSSLQSVLIADIDHNGKDDILRYRFRDFQHGIWEVSWDGRSDWTTLQELTFPPPSFDVANSAANVFGLVGRFRNAGRADLVSVNYTRMGQVYDIGSRQFLPHSLYAY